MSNETKTMCTTPLPGMARAQSPITMAHRPRVLVVDDNAGVRESLRLILRPHHEVATANGQEALHVLPTFHPDLVFVEIRAPSADALALLQQIKTHDSTMALVVMSVSTAWERLKEIFADEPFEYLIKPFFPREVEETVRRALAQKSVAQWRPASSSPDGAQIGDRRRYPRVKVDWAVTLQIQRDGGTQCHGHLRALGPFGAKVAVEAAEPGPPVSSLVRLECMPPEEEAPFAVNGLVWRSDADGVAIVFVDLDPEEFGQMKRRVDTLLAQPA